jgi:hypothetical protein
MRPRTSAVLAIALGLAGNAGPVAAQCGGSIAIQNVPALRVHVDFPVDYAATVNRHCGTLLWQVVSAPANFQIDGAGGRFYWTPAVAGVFTITIRVTEVQGNGATSSDDETFQATVDDSTMISPAFRDYVDEPTAVPILGRAHGTNFKWYKLEFAPEATPTAKTLIAGPVATPVIATGTLATWDVTALPDGGRYLLTLTTRFGQSNSVLTNPVILDRSAKPGWPKRVAAVTHSPVLADLDDDGRDEVIVVTHSGELWAWRADGWLEFLSVGPNGTGFGPTYSAASVGDVDGDGRPEVVWATIWDVYAHRSDGSVLPGFPIHTQTSQADFRSPPTLADLDGDGRLDIVLTMQGTVAGGHGRVLAYRVVGGGPAMLPGWPQETDHTSLYHSASVADVDGDGGPDVVVASLDRVYAWHGDGTPLASGLHRAPLAAPIVGGTTNGAGGSASTAQPALADIDGDGGLEVMVGSNVLRADGTPLPGWEGAKAGATNALSAAVGDLDRNPANGLEVVLGRDAWHASGAPVGGRPLAVPLAPAILGDCGARDLDALSGYRDDSLALRGVDAFELDGARVAGYPKSLYGNTGDAGAPVIGDFDADGLVDVAAAITDATYGGVIAVWDMPGPNHDEHHDWPMLGHDARHTGAWAPPPPNRPTALVRTVVGGCDGVRLDWHDESAVEEGYVVEASGTGTAWTWATRATLPAGATMYSDPSGTAATSYRVRARRRDPRSGAWVVSRPSNRVP